MKTRTGILVLTASLALAPGCDLSEQQEVSPPASVVDVTEAETAAREEEAVDALFWEAGTEFNVPPALLKAIAFVQTRYQMVEGSVEFEGRPAAYGMMALSGAQLGAGAKLANVTEEQARTDARSNVRAAAALLSHRADALGLDRTRAEQWAPAVGEVSGIESEEGRRSFVQAEVFRVARLGVGALSREWAASGQALPEEELGQQAQALAGPTTHRRCGGPRPTTTPGPWACAWSSSTPVRAATRGAGAG